MQREANDRLALIVSGFDATVGRFRYLSAVLSPADPIRELHRNPGDAATITAANRYLQSLNQNLIVSGYTAINAVVKAELFPARIRALGVGLPYAVAVSIFGGSAPYIALWFKDRGNEAGFYWYVTALILGSLLVYVFMADTRRTSQIDRDQGVIARGGHVGARESRSPTNS